MSEATPAHWQQKAASAIAYGASVYVLFLAILKFRDMLWVLPIVAGGLYLLFAGQRLWQSVMRVVLLVPLLLGAVFFLLISLFIGASIILPVLAAGLLTLWAVRQSTVTRRLLGLLPAVIGLTAGLVALLYDQPDLFWRFIPGWVAFAAIAILAVRQREAASRPMPLLALIVLMASLPVFAAYFNTCQSSDTEHILTQPDVELLFDNDTSLKLPESRMEFLCDPTTGTRVVTPNSPSRRVGLIDPDGDYRSVILLDEASAWSSLRDGVLYTGPRGFVAALDIASEHLRYGPQFSNGTFVFANLDSAGETLIMVEDYGDHFTLVDAETLNGLGNYPLRCPAQVLPLGDGTVLVSQSAPLQRHLQVVNLADGKVLRENKIFDVGLMLMTFDDERNLVYAPSMGLGVIFVIDPATLNVVDTFRVRLGITGALIEPGGERLYSFTYLDGVIFEHELPGGRVLRQWRVGGLLHGIRWDCDGKSILATNCLGGFRVRVKP